MMPVRLDVLWKVVNGMTSVSWLMLGGLANQTAHAPARAWRWGTPGIAQPREFPKSWKDLTMFKTWTFKWTRCQRNFSWSVRGSLSTQVTCERSVRSSQYSVSHKWLLLLCSLSHGRPSTYISGHHTLFISSALFSITSNRFPFPVSSEVTFTGRSPLKNPFVYVKPVLCAFTPLLDDWKPNYH